MSGKKNERRPRSGGGLGNLGEALKQAGVLSEERARQLSHKERVHQGKVGREQVEADRNARAEEIDHQLDQQRAEVREAQGEHDARTDGRLLAKLVEEGTIRSTGRGKRFHFVARDGRIPFVEVADLAYHQLVDGGAGIVEVPGTEGRDFAVVGGRDRLEMIGRIDAEAVRFRNR